MAHVTGSTLLLCPSAQQIVLSVKSDKRGASVPLIAQITQRELGPPFKVPFFSSVNACMACHELKACRLRWRQLFARIHQPSADNSTEGRYLQEDKVAQGSQVDRHELCGGDAQAAEPRAAGQMAQHGLADVRAPKHHICLVAPQTQLLQRPAQ